MVGNITLILTLLITKEGLMRLLTILLLCFYGFNVLADTCGHFGELGYEGEATIIASTEQVQLNEVEFYDVVYADPVEMEFSVERCVYDNPIFGIDYSLIVTVTPTVPGKSRGAFYKAYDLALIQNNQQNEGHLLELNYSDNLYVAKSYFTHIFTNIGYDGYIPSSSDIDLSQPFTLILSCGNTITTVFDACSEVNSDHYFELNPQLGQNNTVISTVNGAWYDPTYNGSGFNMVQTANGLQVYFYGYKAGADGEALWLASFLGPKTIQKGETFTLEMTSGFIGNGGSLTSKPNTPNSGLTLWGTADITFDSCSSGEIILTNTDGDSVTHDIILLAGAEGLNCE